MMLSSRTMTIVDEHVRMYAALMRDLDGPQLTRQFKSCLVALLEELEHKETNDIIALSYRVIELSKKLNKAQQTIKDIKNAAR